MMTLLKVAEVCHSARLLSSLLAEAVVVVAVGAGLRKFFQFQTVKASWVEGERGGIPHSSAVATSSWSTCTAIQLVGWGGEKRAIS